MEISLEKIIEIVTKEVVRELISKGVKIEQSDNIGNSAIAKNDSLEVDMSGFKTPLLSENNLITIDENIRKLIVPEKTIITPGARHIIKQKNLSIIYKS
ncbi:MAG: hypothetical protein ABFS35_16210 [Bacteroidota bacterium]